MPAKIDTDDLPFEVPPFKEDDFIRKELISFKTTIILFVYCILSALITYFIWNATRVHWAAILLIVAVIGVGIKPMYKVLKIPTSTWKRKEWIGTFALYFFFWIGFTLLIFNPPITDNAPPAIDVAASPGVQGSGFPVEFTALVRDNRALDEGSVRLCVLALESGQEPIETGNLTEAERSSCNIPWSRTEEGHWQYVWTDTAGSSGDHQWFVEAADKSGRVSEATGVVTIATPLAVFPPAPASAPTFDEVTDRLVVEASEGLNLYAVQYTIDGAPYNMAFDEDQDYWYTTPRFPGWHQGSNNVTVSALEQPTWLDQHRAGGRVAEMANATWTIEVAPGFPVGVEEEPTYDEDRPHTRVATPGFEAIGLLVSLALVAVLRRSR